MAHTGKAAPAKNKDMPLFNSRHEKSLDRFTRLAAVVLDMPLGLLCFADDDWIWLKSCYGIKGTSRVERRASFLNAAFTEGVFTIKDAARDPFDSRDPLAGNPWGIRFSAMVPLLSADEEILAVLSVMDKKARPFPQSKIGILCGLADMLAEYIDAQVALDRQQQGLQRIVHDLKNPLTTISLSAELILEEQNISEDTGEMSRQIALAAKKMTGMVNGILQ